MPISLRTPLTLALVTAALALASPLGTAAAAEPDLLRGRGVVVDRAAPKLPDIAAASWLVADLDTGEVLAAKDAHGRYAPASALKTLTALTLLPVVEPTRRITPTFDDVAVDGTKVGLVERVSYPASELFGAMLMVSGNDAASALATSAGGQQATAARMNAVARDLGALDTLAVNPHGLDAPGQVSSAYDLAVVLRAGLDNPDFARYVTTRSSSVGAPGGARITTVNKNKLLTSYPGTLGGKNGFTTTARASYVGAAVRGDRRLVVALLKSTPKVFDQAALLLDWGFSTRGAEPVGTLPRQEPEAASLPVVSATRVIVPPADLPDPAQGTGLPVTLAGMGLAAAAVFSVRHRPVSAGSGARRARRAGRARRSGG